MYRYILKVRNTYEFFLLFFMYIPYKFVCKCEVKNTANNLHMSGSDVACLET